MNAKEPHRIVIDIKSDFNRFHIMSFCSQGERNQQSVLLCF